MTTTSDWTTLTLESGGEWVQPVTIAQTDTASVLFEGEHGERLALLQSLAGAEAGTPVEMTIEVGILNWEDPLRFRIERGGLGYTEVTVVGLRDGTESGSRVARWDGWSDELVGGEHRNPHRFEVTRAELGL